MKNQALLRFLVLDLRKWQVQRCNGITNELQLFKAQFLVVFRMSYPFSQLRSHPRGQRPLGSRRAPSLGRFDSQDTWLQFTNLRLPSDLWHSLWWIGISSVIARRRWMRWDFFGPPASASGPCAFLASLGFKRSSESSRAARFSLAGQWIRMEAGSSNSLIRGLFLFFGVGLKPMFVHYVDAYSNMDIYQPGVHCFLLFALNTTFLCLSSMDVYQPLTPPGMRYTKHHYHL